MSTLFYVLTVMAGAFLVFAFGSRIRYSAIARKRRAKGLGFEHFRGTLGNEAPEDLLLAAYEHFSTIATPPIPVLPGDDLGKVYGVVGGDVADEVWELADKCLVPRPSLQAIAEVRTVGDVVVLLQSPDAEP